MSNEGDYGGQPSTTTISTVAVQAGDSRIIVALLKCGTLVQLQLAESTPNLLEIGSNQDETKKLLHGHEVMLVKLKAHEDGVWSLLGEADKTAEENLDQEQVYTAMATTLSEAWVALIDLLEKRKALLHLASEFFDRALDFAIKIDEAEDFLQNAQEFQNADCLKELLHKHSYMKKVLLEKSMSLLNKSQELQDFIKDFKVDDPAINSEAIRGARSSCLKIESLLEMLQDRRRQLNEQLKQQRMDLEHILEMCHWNQQEQEVTNWLKEHAEVYLERDQLGLSLSENEELLQEYQEFELKAKERSLYVERLTAKASAILMAEDYRDKEEVLVRSQKLKALHDEIWHQMLERGTHLQEANAFFSSANKAFNVLGSIEGHLKLLNSESFSLPELAKRQEELQKSIKETAAEALQRGQSFLSKANPQSSQLGGIQKMTGDLQGRVSQLTSQCQAHKELAVKKQQLITSTEDHFDKASSWVEKCSFVLSSNVEPGSCLAESEDVLNKHLELSLQTKEVVNELGAFAEIITELKTFESPEVTEFSNKSCLLNEELNTLSRNISSRVEIMTAYVTFLKSAKEVDEQIQNLEEFYRSKPMEEDNEESSKSMMEIADVKWQSLLERFLTVQDLGHHFINSSNMVSENLNLNVKAAVTVVENTREDLSKKKVALTELWTTWQLHVNQLTSVKKQWRSFKEQLEKTVHDLKTVEDVLAPASKVELGSNLRVATQLQDNFNQAKPQFQQLNAEVEYMVKISELLVLKGIPVKENNEMVAELLHIHQRVKERINEYEAVLNRTVKFHQLFHELENLLKSEPVTAFHDISQAKIQLSQHQGKQTHIRHLYKLAITLGVDITTTVQQSSALGFSVQQLQKKLEALEAGCVNWSTEADKYEENLLSNVHYCSVKEEISELKDSFKDLKKKFNNLKFNYMKKNDKSRNLKAVKNQIQQVDMYAEKIQMLKKKISNFATKVSAGTEKQLLGSNPREIEEAVNELQKQVVDFDKTVEEYKQNLDMSVRLQQAMEEYNFWCEEASATIVRVGKYSSECKTREAVGILYKQFEKFVWPTVPQQEERINQITELAVRLHGPEEGKKFIEKTVNKHKEILESIKELCNGLRDLEGKLQSDVLKQKLESSVDLKVDNQQNVKTNKAQNVIGETSFQETPERVELNEEPNRSATSESIKAVHDQTSRNGNSMLDKKLRSQELSENVKNHHDALSEKRSFTEETYSETNTVSNKVEEQNFTTVQRQEQQRSTVYSCTQTIRLSVSPIDPGRRITSLHQTGNWAQGTQTSAFPADTEALGLPHIQEEFKRMDMQGHRHSTNNNRDTQNDKVYSYLQSSTLNTQTKDEDFVHRELPHSVPDDFLSQDVADILHAATEGSGLAEGDLQNELLTDETLSIDEYECASPDDISLPPLSETPESNILHSETDLEDGFCLSSHSLHVNTSSQQTQSQFGNNRMTDSFDFLTPVAAADTLNHRREWVSSQSESYPSPPGGLYPKFKSESSSFVRSPLTVPAPGIVSDTLSSILKSKPANNSSFSGAFSECCETHYALHESFTETQECLQDPNKCIASSGSLHASPAPLTTDPLAHKSEHDTGFCKPTTIREEIRLPSGTRAMSNITGQGPNFSRLLPNATVVEGSPVTLEVEVTGFPEPTLTWYRNGQKLTNDEHIELSQKEGKHSLFIKKATDSDAGLYVVRAKNSSGTLSSSAILQVKVQGQPPNFKTKIEDKVLLVGEDLFLECTVSGRPTPHILWLKDHVVVASGESKIQNLSDTHVLLKRKVGLADTGKYFCIAKNEAGEACCSAFVVVTDG
ncbi:coiled-coil domain-containing protein 141-like [Acipenser oxyrinchus oxyrinchus]|uniref:Coiled-coil domain-containing protein 141-like n=1 Tax=Acipenser oxyrinchus oxyrinchus TaxID=40147 RepID=A0AAD8DBC3_ACIOX|nr:coiled-coil domain-containing protein 141-like [Acipenser oxyrinchus oxyrinchus]